MTFSAEEFMGAKSFDIEPLSPGNDRPWLIAALAIVFVVRALSILNTEVTAPDSVTFIRYALEFERKSWGDVVRGQHQHPLFPYLVRLASVPLRAYAGEATPDVMRFAAQLVNLAASLVLVLPTYRLGCLLGHRGIGMAGAVLFQTLPTPSHILSDGISEGTYLCCVAAGLWWLVRGFQESDPRFFALAGAATGFAYLTRPEGVIVGVVGCAALLAFQVRPAWRLSLAKTASCFAALVVAALVVGALLYVPISAFSNKPTTQPPAFSNDSGSETSLPHLSGRQLWAVNIPPTDRGIMLVLRSIFAVVSELDKNLFHFGWVGVVAGAIWLGGPLLRSRAGLMLLGFASLYALMLVGLGIRARYVADRHVLPIVMLLAPLSVAGFLGICARARVCFGRTTEFAPFGYAAMRVMLVVVALLLLAGMPKTLQRLHGGRAANRIAGQWLAHEIKPEDDLVDPHGVSSLYAEVFANVRDDGSQRFYPRLPASYPNKTWIVVTRDREQADSDIRRSNETELTEKHHGKQAYRWPPDRPDDEAKVVVYVVEPPNRRPLK